MNPYSASKLHHHPQRIRAMRNREHQNPQLIHFMPMLACNHYCKFCSYGHRTEDDGPDQFGWKNMQLMTDDYMPCHVMKQCVSSWMRMGVEAVELTGGGEPLLYPYVDELLRLLAAWGVKLGLVTNGTPLTESRANLLDTCDWQWVRVSIDAGEPITYCETRRVSKSHWKLAWKAVERMAARRQAGSDQRVGAGFVVDHANYSTLLRFCKRAKEAGADNVRLAVAFTPHGEERFPEGALQMAAAQALEAKTTLEDDTFKVNDLINERHNNIIAAAQDYEFCGVKEVMAVVGPDAAYTCCTLAFNELGKIGDVNEDQTFEQLWWNPKTIEWFAAHDAREVCQVPCLYEQKNRRVLEMLDSPQQDVEAAGQACGSCTHRSFV